MKVRAPNVDDKKVDGLSFFKVSRPMNRLYSCLVLSSLLLSSAAWAKVEAAKTAKGEGKAQ